MAETFLGQVLGRKIREEFSMKLYQEGIFVFEKEVLGFGMAIYMMAMDYQQVRNWQKKVFICVKKSFPLDPM